MLDYSSICFFPTFYGTNLTLSLTQLLLMEFNLIQTLNPIRFRAEAGLALG